jgi:hypothetical protein
METERLIDLANDLELNWQWYSGRGMSGKQCFAICTDGSAVKVVCQLISAAIEADDYETWDLCEMLSHAKEDSMGLGTVAYWPRIEQINYEPGSEE